MTSPIPRKKKTMPKPPSRSKAGPMPVPKRKPASTAKSTKASRTARSKAVGRTQQADRARSTSTKRGSSTTRATRGAESLGRTRARSTLRPADPTPADIRGTTNNRIEIMPRKKKKTPGKVVRRPVKPTMPRKKKAY